TVAPDLVNDIMRQPYRERLSLIISSLGAGVAGNADSLNAAIRRAVPALRETDNTLAILGTQTRTLQGLTQDADRVVGDLAGNRAIVLRHLDDRRYAIEDDPRSPGGKGYTGLEALLQYVYDQTLSTNVYDQSSHILKLALIAGGDCTKYADVARAKQHGAEC